MKMKTKHIYFLIGFLNSPGHEVDAHTQDIITQTLFELEDELVKREKMKENKK